MSDALVILGYGIFEETNSIYRDYIDRALSFAEEKQIDTIILCGGYTNKNFQVSESASIQNYILKHDSAFPSKIFLEEKSITTKQNLQFSAEILTNATITPDNIFVFCDSIRATKVYYLALQYFSSFANPQIVEEQIYQTLLAQFAEQKIDITQDVHLKYGNIEVKGVRMDRNSKEIGDQITATVLEIGAYNYPSVEKDILNYKRVQFEINN